MLSVFFLTEFEQDCGSESWETYFVLRGVACFQFRKYFRHHLPSVTIISSPGQLDDHRVKT